MRAIQFPFPVAAVCAVLLGASEATSQVISAADFQPRNDAGVFSIKRSFNATALTFVPNLSCNAPGDNVDCFLVSAIFHKGRYWVLSRLGWGRNLGETLIYEWTVDGQYVDRHAIPIPDDPQFDETGPPSQPEVRDMATDDIAGGEAVMIGSEEGLYITRYNEAQNKWELAEAGTAFETIMSANGPKTISGGDFTNPIRGPALAKLRYRSEDSGDLNEPNTQGEGFMGVAYDPAGNGGNGSLWVGADADQTGNVASGTYARNYALIDGVKTRIDGIKSIFQIALDGTILTEFLNGPAITDPDDPRVGKAKGGDDAYWVAGGLELDPLTGNLWVNTDPFLQDTIEVDITTGVPTGVAFPGFINEPNRTGGLHGLPLGDPGSYPSFWDLIAFTNVGGDDFFTVHRVHQYPGFHGLREPHLQASTGNLSLRSASPVPYTNEDTFNLLINPEGRGSFAGTSRPNFPAILMFDFNDDTLSDAETDLGLGLGVIPELRVHSPLSNPPATQGSVLFSTSTGQELNLDLSNFPVNTGDRFRVQALYLEPFSQYSPGLMVSNEIWASGVGINQVLVEADGENSFGVYADGFWRVTWLRGPPIAKVLFHLRNTVSNGDLADARFDTDEPAMNDVFGMGRGIDPMGNFVDLAGCDGTYRNDSDLSTGLVFNANNHSGVTPAGTHPACNYWIADQGYTSNSGFVATAIQGRNSDDSASLEFNFTDFGLDDGAPFGVGETEAFGFDADTDNVVRRGGGHMGTVITVTLVDGTVFEAELLPDPEDRNRAFIAW